MNSWHYGLKLYICAFVTSLFVHLIISSVSSKTISQTRCSRGCSTITFVTYLLINSLNSLSRWSFCSESSRHGQSPTVRAKELTFWENVHPPTTCHMSCVTCNVSCVRCHISGVKGHNFFSCPEQLLKSSYCSVGRSVGRSVRPSVRPPFWKSDLKIIKW